MAVAENAAAVKSLEAALQVARRSASRGAVAVDDCVDALGAAKGSEAVAAALGVVVDVGRKVAAWGGGEPAVTALLKDFEFICLEAITTWPSTPTARPPTCAESSMRRAGGGRPTP